MAHATASAMKKVHFKLIDDHGILMNLNTSPFMSLHHLTSLYVPALFNISFFYSISGGVTVKAFCDIYLFTLNSNFTGLGDSAIEAVKYSNVF